MATSGSANLTYTGTNLVTQALRRIGVRVSETAETYTATATIVAAAFRRVGIQNADVTETYTTPDDIAQRALQEIGFHDATSQQRANAESALAELGAAWARHGMTKSGTSYPDQWLEALIYNTAMRFALTEGRPVRPELKEIADRAYAESVRHPVADLSSNAEQILTELGDSWAQYGMTKSGATWPDRWVAAFTNNVALRLALENNRAVPAGLPELAAMALQEARDFTRIDTGLTPLNHLLQNWNGLGIRVWAMKSKTITLTAAKASYTVGESGKDVTMTIPIQITQASLRNAEGEDTPLAIWDRGDYDDIADKDDSGDPSGIFYDRALNAETIHFWPVIAASGSSLVIRYQARIEEFDAITDDVFCAPEWHEAIVTHLAMILAPEHDKPVTQALAGRAQQAFSTALGAAHEIPQQPMMGWAV